MKGSVPAAVGFVVLLVSMGGVASSWTQAGYDAARTNHAPGKGPLVPDVAFQVELPGAMMLGRPSAGPLIHDGQAFVAVRSVSDDGATGVVRVNLSTTAVEPFVALGPEREMFGIALDEDRLVVATLEALEIYHLSDGAHEWSWSLSSSFGESPTSGRCTQPAVRDGTVYLACYPRYEVTEGVVVHDYFVAAVPLSGPDADWIWRPNDELRDASPWYFMGVTVTQTHVLTTDASMSSIMPPFADPSGIAAFDFGVVALSRNDGSFQWRMGETAGHVTIQHPLGEENLLGVTGIREYTGFSAHPTGTANSVYLRFLDEVLALNPHQGPTEPEDAVWAQKVGDMDMDPDQTFGAFAMDEDLLFTTSTETLYRFDRENPEDQWRWTLDPEAGEFFRGGDLILADGVLYALAHWRGGGGTTLYALDADTREVKWRHEIPADPEFEPMDGREVHLHSLGEGVIAVAGVDGSFQVIGTTPASLTAVAEIGSPYVDPGEEVQVDLTRTLGGVHGNATRYMALWGDGSVTDWQDSPVLTHRYTEMGDVRARFVAGNEAGQTASAHLVFLVGQEPPVEPPELNLLQRVFAQENQNLTFGVLGILVALSGGVIGVAHRTRKRNRLQTELVALETGYEKTRENPGECEAFLDTRKARARSLMIDGDLEEQQFAVIEKRVEELHRELRTEMLDSRFQFLPHGMVTSMKKALADGHINAWEREALDALLEREEGITEAQKERVRAQLDRWLVIDKGKKEVE